MLVEQKRQVDVALSRMKATVAALTLDAYPPSIARNINEALVIAQFIEKTRDDISARRIDGPQAIAYFSTLIAQLLTLPTEATKTSPDSTITVALLA